MKRDLPGAGTPARAQRGSSQSRTRRALAALAPALLLLAQAQAAEVSVHGFGTIGAAYLDQPEGWAYTRSLNQRSSREDLRPELDSLIGLQLNYRPSATLELVGQATAAVLDEAARPADYLDLAFVAWRPDDAWTLRLGRLNLDAYLLSDHRDVGFTYQFIRPPVEFYSRMPASLDGADVLREWFVGEAQWTAKAFIGHTSAGTGAGRLKLWPLYGLMLSRESGGLLLRISALQGRPSAGIPRLDPLLEGLRQMQLVPVPGVVAQAASMERALTTKNVRTDYLAAAAAYDRNEWLVTAEINTVKADGRPSISFTSGYVSLGRRFGPLSIFVMESVAWRRGDPLATPDWATPLAPIDAGLAQQAQALAIGATTAINRSAADQSTTSAGIRWDIGARVALKAQWDHIRTRRDGGGLWSESDNDAHEANVVAVALDFVF
jgi:hypothetical protein